MKNKFYKGFKIYINLFRKNNDILTEILNNTTSVTINFRSFLFFKHKDNILFNENENILITTNINHEQT